MKRATILGMATLWMAAAGAACGGSADPQMAPISPAGGHEAMAGTIAQASSVTSTPAARAGGAPIAGVSGSAAGATTTMGGSPASAAAATAGATAAGPVGMNLGGSAAPGGSGAAADGGGAAPVAVAGTGGSAGAAGAGPSSVPSDIPAPMAAPLVWGFGVGITDVPAATKFYTEVMKMTVEKNAVKREDRTETVLYGTQAMRGARVVLMKFDDMRNTRKITAKLVWQAQDAAGVNRAASMFPDYESRLNIGIVQFDGPETYIHEVGSVFDSGGSAISVPYPIALGFAVSDQPASRKFYMALGMAESSLGTFSVTDANGSASITEYSLKFADGMGLVLQQWSTMRHAKDNPVKVVMFVPDAKAMADKVMGAGGSIVKPAERTPVYDNRLLVVAKDLDGYLLDIVE
jgi:predicted enzyme related to lactoylglutathione lyase